MSSSTASSSTFYPGVSSRSAISASLAPPSACSWLPSDCFSILTTTPLSQTYSAHLLQPPQKCLCSAQPVAKPCCTCIPFLPPDVALREPAPFSPLDANIPQPPWLFQVPASSLSSCTPFLPPDPEINPAILIKINKILPFRLHNNPPQVYNHIYYQWASFTVVWSGLRDWASNPKALAHGTLACGLVQLGLMRRRKHPLFQLSHLPPHQTLIRWAA